MNFSNLSAPVLIGFFILNIALSLFTAVPHALTGAELAGCENVPAWACGGPFENIAKAGGGGNLSGWERLVAGTIGTVTALIGMMTLNYELLKADGGIVGVAGFAVRALGWLMVAILLMSLASSVLGRR